MKISTFVLVLGGACSGLIGCDGHHKEIVRSPSMPVDPSAWTGSSISKGDDVGGGSSPTQGLPGTSSRRGAMSSEGADIERSLGVH